MTNYHQWLIEAYHNQAHEYRVALEREVQHTKRIFGEPLREDVRRVLLQSLKEIPTPKLAKYEGNDKREESVIKIFNTTPRPNFVLIMMEVVGNI